MAIQNEIGLDSGQPLVLKQNNKIICYAEYDFIPEFEPDPPWMRLPKQNHAFLIENLVPLVKEEKCPYCGTKIDCNLLKDQEWPSRMKPMIEDWEVSSQICNAYLYHCKSCGWWSVLQEDTASYHHDSYSSLIDLVSVHWAKIKEFDVRDLETPINNLQAYLAKEPEKVDQLSDEHLTEVLASCFREFFACEVLHIGGLGKDAIDTFLINADKPTLILVKRREAGTTGSVQAIHELLGVRIVENHYNGIVVSTAATRFSNLALTEWPVIIDKGFTISLYNYDALFNSLKILKEVKEDAYKPWEDIWKPLASDTK